MKTKVFDCITFFEENFMANLRFEILNPVVDYFVICESQYNHRNKKKKFNFKLKNKKFSNKIIYIKLRNPFPSHNNLWQNQGYQRDYILQKINANDEDLIMYSDPDEIPNPEILKKINIKKKYGIFLQKHFVYKFNVLNNYEDPWLGTRICKSKNLKSIDYMRQKVLLKNLKKWWRPDKEKSIELYENGGWHFNNFLTPEQLSRKLKTFAHTEFASEKYSNIKTIKKKIKNLEDLYGRNQKFKLIKLREYLPEHVLNNISKFGKYIIYK